MSFTRRLRETITHRPWAPAGLAAIAVAFTVAGCGGSSTATGKTGSANPAAGMTTVKVGAIAIGTQVPLYLGIEKGFFKDVGLDVKPQIMAGGSAIVPAIVQGSVQFGFVNGATVVFGASRGLPLKVVSGGEGAPATGHRDQDLSRLVVAKSSPITSARQLDGKTVAVSSLRDAPELLTRVALSKQGVDLSTVHFQEIPYADMLAALDAGRVNAAYVVTPFADQATAAGDRTLARPYYDTKPGLATAYYCVSSTYAAAHPAVAAAFQRAMLRSMAYANAHPAQARALLPSYTKIPKPIIAKTQFGHFPTTIADATSSLTFFAQEMVRFGWLKSSPNINQLVVH